MIELSVNNLHLNYGDNPVLKGVSMSLRKGEVISLLGPSGSGKTTLLRAIAGLEEAQKGEISIGDRKVFDGERRLDTPAEDRNLGLVFQSYALWPHFTVFENVAYPLKLRKTAQNEIKERVQAVLQQLGLAHLAKRYPHALSGGQQQRVAIARALVYNPPVLLLDEPLSNLDAKMREDARVFLRELIVDFGLSALMVTHDQSEAMAISDRILLLNNGKIVQEGTPEEMYSYPETLFTAEFMGSNNRLFGKIIKKEDDRILLEGNSWQLWGRASQTVLDNLKVGSDATAMVRVEKVKIVDTEAENTISLPRATTMFLGDRWETVFRHDESLALRVFSEKSIGTGTYHLDFPAEAVWIYPKE